MSFESTPGVTVRRVEHPLRDGVEAHTELIFVFDLSKMTLATAFANPVLSDQPISEWTVEQLYRVMLEPKEPSKGRSEAARDEAIEKLRPLFLRCLVLAIEGSPFNGEAVRFAARHDPENGNITAFRSTYSTPKEPERVKNTVLTVSTEATRFERLSGTSRLRDDLLQPRDPSGGLIGYVQEFRRLRLDPLQRLIARNDVDVRKVLSAMAYVQQINLALSFAKDCSLNDRTEIWRDFFEKVQPLGSRYSEMTGKELKQLFLHGGKLCRQSLDHVQIAKLRDFREKQIDPLIDQLGKAAAWARAAEVPDVKVCASAKKRDDEAKSVLRVLRKDDVLLDALDQWDELAALEQFALSALFDDLIAALSRCPGATKSLLASEFMAVARGAAGVVTALPEFPQETTRQKFIAEAVSRFDPETELVVAKPNAFTKVISDAFKRYSKTRKIASPIIVLWAHANPAILARFDKSTPSRVSPKGTAYLFRSVVGIGVLTSREMKALYSDLDSFLESALTHGVAHKETTRRLETLFEVELSHGKYPVRSNWWSDGRIYNSIKLAVGLLGIRQGFISAAEDKTLSAENFIDLSAAILHTTDAARELRHVVGNIFGAGKSAIHHAPSFLNELTPAAKLARVTELVSLISSYQAVLKTQASSLARDQADADLAVAWLSLVIVVYETALGTTFPVAGLALILLRWVLFDEDLWNLVGQVTSKSPAVKVVRGIMDKLMDGTEEIGKMLRLAPNWGTIEVAIERVRDLAPEIVATGSVGDFGLYFHIETDHDEILRRYAVRSYGITEEISELIIEG